MEHLRLEDAGFIDIYALLLGNVLIFSKYASTFWGLVLCKTYSFFSRNLSFGSRLRTEDEWQPK